MKPESFEQKREDLAKLVSAQAVEDVWTTPAMEEKLRIAKLGAELAASRDPAVQHFVLEQVRLCKHIDTAGALALNLVGEVAAAPEVLLEIEPFLDTAPPTSRLYSAAVLAVLAGDGAKAVERLAPILDVEAPDTVGLQRIQRIAGMMFRAKPLRPLIERVMRASLRLNNSTLTAAIYDFPGGPGWEEERAHLLALDLPPTLVSNLIYRAVVGGRGLDSKRLKVVLPLLQAEAASLRDDPSARPRLEAVENVLKLPGALLGMAKVKLPKAAAKVALKQEVGTEGGPVLALPKEAVAAWRGVLLPNGKPGEGDFAGTDYGRACEVKGYTSPWRNYGFLDVGEHRGLVLGQHCQVAKLKDGTCLLVMEGDGEGVAALLKETEKPWKKLTGELVLPSGELVLFDCAMENAKTNNKSTVKLPPGTYAVEELGEDGDEPLWIVRLSRVAGGP